MAELATDVVNQSVFLMRHGARQDTACPDWRKTASRPYDTPLSGKGHLEAAQLAKRRLKGKVGKYGCLYIQV